jgi:tetratricopeptide (TPR) repeat protein
LSHSSSIPSSTPIRTRKDSLGHAISAPSRGAIDAFEQALAEFQCYRGDPVASIVKTLDQDPAFPLGQILLGYLNLLGTEPSGLGVAQGCLESACDLPANPRERAHLRALAHLIRGEWRAAGRVLEDIAIDHPLDALAIQVGHLVDFYTGDSRMLRDRIARAIPHWSSRMPGYHAVLGMHAFGLEETGLYDRAEGLGRRAVELEPRDAWAWHAVAHCMEMQGRQSDGIRWLEGDPDAWSRDNFFAVHNWWHLALFHLDLEEVQPVLGLYDGPIRAARSPLVLDLIDASALLWRLQLRDLPVGGRWQELADAWEPLAGAGNYAFNDVHAMMAFVCADRPAAIESLLEAQARATQGAGDNRDFVCEVGAPVTRAMLAFGRGDYRETQRLLRPVRNRAQRFGGSHAQRDLLDLTLIESALRDGHPALARALIAERADLRPQSPANRTLTRRARGAARLAA